MRRESTQVLSQSQTKAARRKPPFSDFSNVPREQSARTTGLFRVKGPRLNTTTVPPNVSGGMARERGCRGLWWTPGGIGYRIDPPLLLSGSPCGGICTWSNSWGVLKVGRVAFESPARVVLAPNRPLEAILITVAGSPCSDGNLEGRQ